MVRNWALLRLKELRATSEDLYAKMEEWIEVAFKAETDAILELETVIKSAIEDQEKLQYSLKLKYMDFFLDQKILYFYDPPPEVYPAREEVRTTRFTIE